MKKKNDKWRMCVDYTDLNKACLSDPFALPRIHQLVESIVGYELYSFLDAYLGYHQINLQESDCIYTSFTIPFGVYYYISMPFGLKMLEQLINVAFSGVCTHRLGGMWRLMLMTLW